VFPIRDNIPSRHLPIVTWLVILVNAGLFVLELGCPQSALEQVFYLFGIVPRRYTDPEWAAAVGFAYNNYWNYWPFVTHQFLHAGWLHILSNMWILWIFGDNVEDRMGPVRFLVFYLICGVGAGVVHLLTNPSSVVPTIGASGAISGVLGAYLLLFPYARVLVMVPLLFWPFFFVMPAFFYLVLWFFMQFFSGSLALASPSSGGGVAWWAHVGGFLLGLICCRFFVPSARRYYEPYEDEYGLDGAWSERRRSGIRRMQWE